MLAATALYAALTLVFTWPLAPGLTHDIPGDFGDPLLNAWILAWDATHLGRGWWNANIFYPHPLALGYSEHLLPQALQAMPVYWITRNPTLSYNVVFLSTFVFSGLGMFLFVRELTGDRAPAFVAGVAYAFAPYRVPSMPHIQVLSSVWLPFALFGFRRYFSKCRAAPPSLANTTTSYGGTGTQVRPYDRFWPLLGAASAWLAQNLSSGYYLIFCAPVVFMYLVWEITTRSLWRDRRAWLPVCLACAAVGFATVPLLVPYLELRRLGFSPRSLSETTKFSADVWAYLTADPNMRFWGPVLQGWPKAEGSLFPGLTIVALAVLGTRRAPLYGVPVVATAAPLKGAPISRPPAPHKGVPYAAALAGALLLITTVLGFSIRLPGLKITSFPRALVIVTALAVVALAVSTRARAALLRWLATPAGLFAVVTVFAVVMSWGPEIQSRGRPVATANLYALFYDYVPGFDGLRVPARFGMIVAFALAVLAGLGVATLGLKYRSTSIAVAAAAAIFVESMAAPIPINQNAIDYRRAGLAALPDTVSIATRPAVYGFVASLPESAALIELPLGEPAFDVRYMFFSTTHWRRLVNGYSGGAPADYERLDETLQDVLTRPDRAWQAIVDSGATHAIVHESLYAGDRGARVSEWLRARGAQQIATFDRDRVFQLR